MATKTITTYEHSCDLCGEVRAEAELEQLHYHAKDRMGIRDAYRPLDICTGCRARPVGEVLDLIAKRKEEAV